MECPPTPPKDSPKRKRPNVWRGSGTTTPACRGSSPRAGSEGQPPAPRGRRAAGGWIHALKGWIHALIGWIHALIGWIRGRKGVDFARAGDGFVC
eukprot:797193-Pyramimonas_sp.AAC.1